VLRVPRSAPWPIHPARHPGARLAGGQSDGTELAKPFAMSLPAISKHLRCLNRRAARREIDGRVHRLPLARGPMKNAADGFEQYRGLLGNPVRMLSKKYLESHGRQGEEMATAKQASDSRSKSGALFAAPREKSRPRGSSASSRAMDVQGRVGAHRDSFTETGHPDRRACT